ncbi:MAG: ferredoxin [Ignavibacteria bacterium]|nr:ferredoxin [Ignavibacteria bacterium]
MEEPVPKRLPQNTEGEYYTNENCDGCAYCAAVAPENFDFNRDKNTYFVSKQPATPEETDYVQEAMDDCPVDAIQRMQGDGQSISGPEDHRRGDAA